MSYKLSASQSQWVKKYQTESGFEALYVHEFEAGNLSFYELVQANLSWLESHQNERYKACEKVVSGMYDDLE